MKHKSKTAFTEHADLDKLIENINNYGALRKSKRELKQEKEVHEIKNVNKSYLVFLGFAMAERLSSQISKLGLFFKTMMKNNKIGFIKHHTFDEEEISIIARNIFQNSLMEDIHKKLESRPFSQTILLFAERIIVFFKLVT